MIDEKKRLQELFDYQILNSPPERELNELAELASLICDTPIALITFIDEHDQWIKASKGLKMEKTYRKDSFCQHALHNPKEVLVVNDSFEDQRFKDSPLVQGRPNIRFYAGAPLETPDGSVLGTLCIIDTEPRKITESQKDGLKILAKKVMNFLNGRKLLQWQNNQIEFDSVKLKKLTDQVPGMIYQFEMTTEGKLSFKFVSKGIAELHPGLDPEMVKENPELGFNFIHPEDLPNVRQSIVDSYTNLTEWKVEFRVLKKDGKIEWHSGRANPERLENGTVVWYGFFLDITKRVEYEIAMEQMSFDIAHILRRPISTLLGLTYLIEVEEMDDKKIKEYGGYIRTVSEEMEKFTRKLNDTYIWKKQIDTGDNHNYS